MIKTKSRPPKEIILQMQVAKILRDTCRVDWIWTHFPAGEKRHPLTARKLKQMGTQPGWPDIFLINQYGLAHCLELKREGQKLNDNQKIFQSWCIAHGVPYVIAWTQQEAITALMAWGCLIVKDVADA